jgi:hypothetical protein
MISALITLIVWLLVVGILYWIVIYVLDAIPIPDPPNRIIKVVLAVVLALAVLLMLLDLMGVHSGVTFPRIGGAT